VIEAVRRRATRGRRAHETIYDDVVRRTATVSSASGPA